MLLAARLRGALIGRWHRTSRAQQQLQQQLFPVATEQQQHPTSRMASSNGASSAPSPGSAIDLIMLLHRLKTTKRTGWVLRDVDQPESIADHMYRMGMMALIAGPAGGVDTNRCIRMALVHDIAEAIVGDITPYCSVSAEEKHRREADAIQQIKDMLGLDTDAAKDVEALWQEYEGASSPEALLVKDFDKLELIVTALQYEQEQGKQLQEFFDSTAGKWRTPLGKAWAEEVVKRRQQGQQS